MSNSTKIQRQWGHFLFVVVSKNLWLNIADYKQKAVWKFFLKIEGLRENAKKTTTLGSVFTFESAGLRFAQWGVHDPTTTP